MIAALADAARAHLAAARPLVSDARGHSMWPTIRDGARVTILPLRAPPRVGDVVLAELGPRDRPTLVLHRVVAIGRGGYILKGDARPEPDGLVPRDRVLGRWDGPSSPVRALASRLSGPVGARILRLARRLAHRLA